MASVLRKITDNWKLKSLAFTLAVLLWVVISAEQVTSDWIWVPLEVEVTDPSYQAHPPEIRDVQVRFTGAGRDLLSVAVGRPPLHLTIPSVDSDSAEFVLSPRMVQLAGQAVSASEVRPSSIRLNFTRMDSRIVPVRPRIIDSLGLDWAVVDSLVVEPAQVRVTGPATRVAQINEIFTDSSELTPTDSIVDRAVALDTTGLGGLELSARTATLMGRVDRVVERVFPNVRVDVGAGVAILPDTVEVRLRGPDRVLRSIEARLFRVVVAIDEIPPYIPPEGLAVPLRADRLRAGIQARINPAEARLYPSLADVDSIPATERPVGADSTGTAIPAAGA